MVQAIDGHRSARSLAHQLGLSQRELGRGAQGARRGGGGRRRWWARPPGPRCWWASRPPEAPGRGAPRRTIVIRSANDRPPSPRPGRRRRVAVGRLTAGVRRRCHSSCSSPRSCVTIWVLAVVVVLRRRRPRREDRSIEAHQQALRALGAMRARPIVGSPTCRRTTSRRRRRSGSSRTTTCRRPCRSSPRSSATGRRPRRRPARSGACPADTRPTGGRAADSPPCRHPPYRRPPCRRSGTVSAHMTPKPSPKPRGSARAGAGAGARPGSVSGRRGASRRSWARSPWSAAWRARPCWSTGGHRRPRPVREARAATAPAQPTPPPSTRSPPTR